MIFEIWSSFCINFAPFCNNLARAQRKAKLKGAHLRESKRASKGRGDFKPNKEEDFPH